MYAPDAIIPPKEDQQQGGEENNNADETANNDADETMENAEGATPGGGEGGGNSKSTRLHRSLPRVKALLEDENYLGGILQSCESSGCASQPVATSTNAWMTAFNSVYSTVATDCHLPQGKNRHHKFKDKVVEVWQAMETEIAEKKQSIAHPLYALGMKQLETYRSVAKEGGEGGKSPKRPTTGNKGSNPASAGGAGVAATPSTGLGSVQQPARKKARGSTGAAALASHSQMVDLSRVFRQGFARLESLASQQLPSNLPSPLHEMHRIRLQLQLREDTELLANMEPYYSEAVGSYLAQVTSQANNSAHPAMLPKVLEGLDSLLQANHDAQLESSIQYTYKTVFQTYLKLINPDISAGTESAQAPGSSRKRKAKDDGKKKSDEGDEEDGTAV